MAKPLILFDGVCNLCNGAVLWILKRDPTGRYCFASLQSAAAREALREAGAPADLPDSMILIEAGKIFLRSDAALGIAHGLGPPWSWLALMRFLPRNFRDAIYNWIARNRYRWFGKREHCLVPTPDLRLRFLDAAEENSATQPSGPARAS